MRVLYLLGLCVLVGQASKTQTNDPISFGRLGVTMGVAMRTFLADPPVTLAKDDRTGQPTVRRGHYQLEREEEWFGVTTRVCYGFSVNDSTLGYVLVNYFESARIKGSPVGLRDSLWDRLIRTRRAPDKRSVDGKVSQCVWNEPDRKIVATRVDGPAKTLVVSMTRPRSNE